MSQVALFMLIKIKEFSVFPSSICFYQRKKRDLSKSKKKTKATNICVCVCVCIQTKLARQILLKQKRNFT